MIAELVTSGGWDRSQPLSRVVNLLNQRLSSDRVYWDTVAKAMDDLFSETQDGRYERRRKMNKKAKANS